MASQPNATSSSPYTQVAIPNRLRSLGSPRYIKRDSLNLYPFAPCKHHGFLQTLANFHARFVLCLSDGAFRIATTNHELLFTKIDQFHSNMASGPTHDSRRRRFEVSTRLV